MRLAKIEASLDVLRTELSSHRADAEAAYARLQSIESDAHLRAVEDPLFSESDAIVRLLELHKDPEKPDA